MAITPERKAELMRFFDGRMLPDELFQVMAGEHDWFPTRPLKRGGRVRHFEPRPGGLPDIQIRDKDRTFDLYDFIATNNVEGMIVLKDGELAFETYQHGMRPDTLWNSCSLAKSVTATAVGIAVKEGAIASLDDPVTKYADLRGGYRDLSVRRLLRMNSGIRWNEDYGDPASERRRLLEIQTSWTKGGIVDFMQDLPAATPAGAGWVYNTGESYLVSAVMEGATGMNLADYTSDRLWSKIGMAHDGRWWVESPDGGMAISGSGVNAALGDYARLGQFVLEDGVVGDDQLLPDGWRDEAGAPFEIDGKTIPYGYMWWVPELPDPILKGSFQAEGIYGQYIHVNPRHGLVVALACARAKPSYRRRLEINDDAFFAAVARAF